MKVKCIRLLDDQGRKIESSPWLTLGSIYHVMSITIDPTGKRSYGIITSEREGEWPSMGSHLAGCFEVISEVIPSNWRPWISKDTTIGISPLSWQAMSFIEAFFDHDPKAYPVFNQERNIILREDP